MKKTLYMLISGLKNKESSPQGKAYEKDRNVKMVSVHSIRCVIALANEAARSEQMITLVRMRM